MLATNHLTIEQNVQYKQCMLIDNHMKDMICDETGNVYIVHVVVN